MRGDAPRLSLHTPSWRGALAQGPLNLSVVFFTPQFIQLHRLVSNGRMIINYDLERLWNNVIYFKEITSHSPGQKMEAARPLKCR